MMTSPMPLDKLDFREGFKSIHVRHDKFGLIKSPDHVFQAAVVDGRFTADAAINHRQQGGRHLNQRDAPHVGGGDKPRQVADNAPAQRQDKSRPFGEGFRQSIGKADRRWLESFAPPRPALQEQLP